MSFSVVIANNHDVTRRGVRLVVEGLQGQVVSAARTGLEAVSMVEEHEPDILIQGLKLPHLSGLDILYHLQRRSLDVSVVVFTTCRDEERVRSVFRRGASAYVLKEDSLEELHRAVGAVRRGRRYLTSTLPDRLMVESSSDDASDGDPIGSLTMREREVLQLTAEGHTSREIGVHLSISPRTVDKHRENIKEKLDIKSLVEMPRFVHQRGVLHDPRILQSRQSGTAEAA